MLGSFYGYEPVRIDEQLSSFLLSDGLEVRDREVMIRALRLMALKNVDFVDAVIAEEARDSGETVASFDDDFKRLGVPLRRV